MSHECSSTWVLMAAITMAWAGHLAFCAEDPDPTKVGAGGAPSFERDIRPLLVANCARCHSANTRKADLDLTTHAGLMRGGESGPSVVPEKPKASLLFEKTHSGAMPPNAKDRLSAAQVHTIAGWIAAGARKDPNTTESGNSLTQHDVIPILLRRCTVCHGPVRQEGKLDLRNRAAMLRGGKSGPAMVPGNPDGSRIIQKLRAGQMPPKDRLVEVSIKPIEAAEIETLTRWIAAGALEVNTGPDIATTAPDPLVTDKDRDFWAFRSPRPVAIPNVRDATRVRNPIDAFLVEKLERKGLGLAPEADPLTLMRRAYFDLTGLPPSPEEVGLHLADKDPHAYEKLIDRLLDSPRYGERWGRFWLDLAGYADSEGKREQDLPRPHAWRYRDYVIHAFNADKPYDRFLLEQLAGDELADYEHAPEITSEIYDNLVATAFLRLAPDASWANITGYIPDRIEVIADEIDILGSAVMGLTLKCARCHSHKFDPIPQRDYYRLLDIFKGAYDEYDWLKPDVRPGLGPVSQDVAPGRHLPFVTTVERRAWEANEARIQREVTAAKAGSATPAQVKAIEAGRTPEPRIHGLWDRGNPSPTYIYRRGDPLLNGQPVGPGVPSVLTDGKTPLNIQPPWPGANKTGRRLAFARWITQPDHPLTSRVAVNRMWKHHFGVGIVKTLGNFGAAGSLPSHPELLDWLARNFAQEGWSTKAMHRLMMTSSAYRQSSTMTMDHQRLDPANECFSRMPLVRLDAEALYDSMLLVAGRLDETRFGPATPVRARGDGLVTPEATSGGWRRLIYVQQQRRKLPTHLENFDFPQMNPNCLERRDSTVAPQALHMLNNGMVFELAENFATRVNGEVGPDSGKQIDRMYLIALNRPPAKEERTLAMDALNQLTTQWEKQMPGKDKAEVTRIKALTAVCHAILNSADFLYVD